MLESWAKEIELIVQTNPENYDTPEKVLLLMEHKSLGIANSIIKNFKPGKYFRKKPLEGKAKFCPKGKKNCRCWISRTLGKCSTTNPCKDC